VSCAGLVRRIESIGADHAQGLFDKPPHHRAMPDQFDFCLPWTRGRLPSL
jgi:hypothetical protein